MFFNAVLLHPQHKMRLNLPWLAACLGVNKLKKDDVIKCDVIKVCNHIMMFITSESKDPSKRFSLRLSAILITGVSQILRQQVIYLQDEIDRSILARAKAADNRRLAILGDSEESPSTPRPAVKKKRAKRDVVETPESLAERLPQRIPEEHVEPEFTLEPLRIPEIREEEAIVLAREDDITLREDVPRPQEPQIIDDFEMGEEFPRQITGIPMEEIAIPDIGAPPKTPEKRIEPEEARLIEEIAPPVAEEMEIPQRVEHVIPEIQIGEPQDVIQTEKEVAPVPRPEIEPVIQVVTEEEVPPTVHPEVEPDKEKDKEAKKKKPTDITQLEVIEPVEEPKVPRRRPPKDILASLLIKRKRKNVVFINRTLKIFVKEPEFIPVTTKIPTFKPMAIFWPDWERETMLEARPERESVSIRPSGSTEPLGADGTAETSRSVSAVSIPSAQQLETPTEATTPRPRYVSTPRKRPHPGDETEIEIMPPAANGDMRHPEKLPKRRKVVSIGDVQAAELAKEGFPEEQELLIPEAPPEPQGVEIPEVPIGVPLEDQMHIEPQPLIIEEVPRERVEREELPKTRERKEISPIRPEYSRDDLRRNWWVRIIKVVCDHKKITPVEICKALKERTTKLNMATIFATLLSLAKNQYVELLSAEDSTELQYVKIGSRQYTV